MFDKAINALLATCAIVLTVIVIRRKFVLPKPGQPRPPEKVSEWRSLSSEGEVIGPANAPVTIVEFSDFQCPYCRRLAAVLDSVMADYPGKVRVVFRHYPLPHLHPSARMAAIAAECAGRQGRFPSMHDQLFRAQDSIGVTSWSAFAVRAEVMDTIRFGGCLTEPAHVARLQRDSIAAESLGITGTPTVMVNEWRMWETPTAAAITKIVRRELGM